MHGPTLPLLNYNFMIHSIGVVHTKVFMVWMPELSLKRFK